MTRALEAAKRARDRGVNVSWARPTLKEARTAFMAGNYALAMERADSILGQLEFGSGAAPPATIPAEARQPSAVSASGLTDLGAAAGRLAEATETVKRAKAHGFNIQAARAALKQAKRAFKARDYAGTVQFADQAIQLSGSTGRTRM